MTGSYRMETDDNHDSVTGQQGQFVGEARERLDNDTRINILSILEMLKIIRKILQKICDLIYAQKNCINYGGYMDNNNQNSEGKPQMLQGDAGADSNEELSKKLSEVLMALLKLEIGGVEPKIDKLTEKVDKLENPSWTSDIGGRINFLEKDMRGLIVKIDQNAANFSEVQTGLENLNQTIATSVVESIKHVIEGAAGRIADLSNNVNSITDRIQALETALKNIDGKIDQNAARFRDAQASLENLNRANSASMQESIKRVIETSAGQINPLTAQVEALAGRTQALEIALQNMDVKIDQNAASFREAQANLENLSNANSASMRESIKGVSETAAGLINPLSARAHALEAALKNIDGKIDDNDARMSATCDSLAQHALKLDEDMWQIKSRLDKQAEENKSLSAELAETSRSLEEARRQLREDEASLAKVKAALNEVTLKLNAELGQKMDLENILKDRQLEIDGLKRELVERQGKLEALSRDMEQEKNNNARFQATTAGDLNLVRAELAPYGKLRDAMLASHAFEELARMHGMDAPGDVGLLACARSLGESVDFLLEVHDWARKKKEENRPFTPIAQDEKQVYAELNNCYRKLWNVDFDVFQQPGGQSVREDFKIVPFDRDEAKSLENPRDTDKRYTQEVYVPVLMKKSGERYKSALVKIGNVNK